MRHQMLNVMESRDQFLTQDGGLQSCWKSFWGITLLINRLFDFKEILRGQERDSCGPSFAI